MVTFASHEFLKVDKASPRSSTDLLLSSAQGRVWSDDSLFVGRVTRRAGTEAHGLTEKDTIALVLNPYSVRGGYIGQKDRNITFLKNDFTYSLEGAHSYTVANKSGQSVCISFDKKFRLALESSLPGVSKMDESLTATSGLPNAAAYAQILQSFLETDGQGGRLRLESLITLLLGDIYARMQKATNTDQGFVLSDQMLSQIKEYIDAKCDQKIGVQELADLASISMFHFSKVFKETTGLPPHQYVIQHRLERVRNLLETSTLSLTQIAYEAGFSSQSHMSVSFLQHFGATPGKYRKSVKT